MKIVVLNGSPRELGNTKTLLKACIKKADENHEISFFNLDTYDITPCQACEACVGLEGECLHQDDTNFLLQHIERADILIFGTPVYWWGISSQLKLIIDKFYAWHGEGYDVGGKQIGIITVGGSSVADTQYRLIADQFQCITDFLKWEIRFNKAYSAYAIGDILKNQEAMMASETLMNYFDLH